MTETEMKLQDAATQMKLAIGKAEDARIFRSCINAFITTARSVTFVMQKESSKDELKSWYKEKQKEMKSNPIFSYFHSKRTHTIHKGVVQPYIKSYNVNESKCFLKKDANGKIYLEGECIIKLDDGEDMIFSPMDILRIDKYCGAWGWYFADIKEALPNNSGNVLNLCEEYFILLKDLVQEWGVRRKSLQIS